MTPDSSEQAPDFSPGLADPRGSCREVSVGPDTLVSSSAIAKPGTPVEASAAATPKPEDIGGSDASASPSVSRLNQPEPQAALRPGILGLQSGEDVNSSVTRKPGTSSEPTWAEPGRAVVVGVDGSERNQAAIDWACAEAVATHRPLTLLHVLDERGIPGPFHRLETDDQHSWRLLNRVEGSIRGSAAGVSLRKELAVGPVDRCLVSRSAESSAIVVGRRGFGTFVRMLIGSTSLSVASHAQVPVIVVPDRWSPSEHSDEPVVVGIDHRDVQEEAVRYAFTEARRRGVMLLAVHGREVPGADWDPEMPVTVNEHEVDHESRAALEHAVAPFRQEFPAVAVTLMSRRAHPLTVLLDQAGPTQLLVLGRHSHRRRGGFPFGSVARAVLHYAEVPVAIVPPSR